MSIGFASFRHLKLPLSIKIPVTIIANRFYLHDSYLTKFDFMNYAFAKLVVAWLYFHKKVPITYIRVKITES